MATKDLHPESVVIVDLDDSNRVISCHSKQMEDMEISLGTISDRYNTISGHKAIVIGRVLPKNKPQAGTVYSV